MTLDEEEALARAAAAPVARLGTLNLSGGVDLVPITFALEARRLVTMVDHKPKRTAELQRLANIERDSRVTVLVDEYDDDWSKLWWVRLRGIARVVRDGAEHEAATAALAAKYPQYSDRPPRGAAIVVDVVAWQGWFGRPGYRSRP